MDYDIETLLAVHAKRRCRCGASIVTAIKPGCDSIRGPGNILLSRAVPDRCSCLQCLTDTKEDTHEQRNF